MKFLDLMPKNSNQTIVLGGDFNLPGIDWDNGVVNLKAENKSQCELLLSSLDTHALAQIHKDQTREENILDLLITNKHGLIKSSHSVPGISDHCAAVTKLDIAHPTVVPNPTQCVSTKRLIRKLSGNKLGAAGPSFQKTVPAVLLMKIG